MILKKDTADYWGAKLVINNIITAVMPLITIWIIYKYLNAYFEKNTNNRWFIILLWGGFYVYQVYFENRKGIASLVVVFLNIIFVLCIASVGYIGSLRPKVIKCMLLYVMWMLVECFTDAILRFSIIDKKDAFLIGSVLSKIIMIVLIQLIDRNKQKNCRKMPWSHWAMLFTVPLGSVFLTYIIYLSGKQNGGHLEDFNTYAFAMLIFINIIIFEVYDKLSYSLEIEMENKMFEQQLVLLANHNEETKKNYDAFRQEQHDYIHHIMVVKNHIKQGESKRAITLLDSLLDICNDNADVISNSGNDIIDTIINYKYSIAKKKNIEFSLRIFIPEKVPFEHRDLCVILGNALDNAIEAAQSSGTPYINVYIGIKKETFVIVIKNSFTGEIKKNNQGKLFSTKINKTYHGYGISSIKKATKKYQGQVIIDILENENKLDKEFGLTIILDWK